jgi:hypothetical protein
MSENASVKEETALYTEQSEHMASFVSAFASALAGEVTSAGPEASRKPIVNPGQLAWAGNTKEDLTPA